MIIIQMPKDIRKYEVKSMGAFSVREIIYFSAAVVMAIPGIMVISKGFSMHKNTMMMLLGGILALVLAAPFIMLAIMKEIERTPTEVYIIRAIYRKFVAPRVRKNKCLNRYRVMFDAERKRQIKKMYKSMSPLEKQAYMKFRKKGELKLSHKKQLKIYH